MRDVRTSHFHQVSRRDLCYVSENEEIRFRVLCLFLVQEEDLLLVQEEDLLLAQEDDFLLVQEKDIKHDNGFVCFLTHSRDLGAILGGNDSYGRPACFSLFIK